MIVIKKEIKGNKVRNGIRGRIWYQWVSLRQRV
jgi:hypothetical protein